MKDRELDSRKSVVASHENHPGETVHMRGHNICLCGRIWKILLLFLLSCFTSMVHIPGWDGHTFLRQV